MPLYDIEHVTPLTPTQQEQLAQALTAAHATRFRTPRFFVNVRFTDASAQPVFRGGVRRRYNRVVLRTRAGSGANARSEALYLEHCGQVVEEWRRVVGEGGELGLRTVWVMGALTTALEMGIGRPRVGEEGIWIEENMPRFRELAAAGDEDFIDFLNEFEAEKPAVEA